MKKMMLILALVGLFVGCSAPITQIVEVSLQERIETVLFEGIDSTDYEFVSIEDVVLVTNEATELVENETDSIVVITTEDVVKQVIFTYHTGITNDEKTVNIVIVTFTTESIISIVDFESVQ
jgi:hypothetical protein